MYLIKLALQCEFTVHKFMCQVIIFLFESHVILHQTFVFSLEKKHQNSLIDLFFFIFPNENILKIQACKASFVIHQRPTE